MNEGTIVTAYYELKNSKYSTDAYNEWIENFMQIPSYMIIFVENDFYASKIYNLRTNYKDKTKILILPFEKLKCYQYMDYWNKDYERDIEKEFHNQNLYILWNEKTAFMKKAKELNPFNTNYYCWCDIGMVREKEMLNYIKTFPSPKMLNIINDNSKVYLLNIDKFTDLEEKYINDACDAFKYTNRNGSGVIVCHKDMVDTWYEIYYEMLNRFMEKDLFAGKDKSIINCIYCKYFKDLQLIIVNENFYKTKENYDKYKWFHLLFYLTDYYYNFLTFKKI